MARVRVLFGIAVALALAAPVHAAPDPDKIDRAADRVITDRFQDLPEAEKPLDAEELQKRLRQERPRDRNRDRLRTRNDDIGESRQSGPGAGLGTVLQFLVWGVLAVAVALIVVAIASELLRKKSEPAAATAPIREEEAPKAALDRPLDDAERLAAEGKFAEAIHVLLLRTFQELTRAAGVTIARSWTSREILSKIWLAPEAREGLVELVRVVELTWFGDDVPGEADWQRCRAQFDRFVTAYRAAPPRAQPGQVAA